MCTSAISANIADAIQVNGLERFIGASLRRATLLVKQPFGQS